MTRYLLLIKAVRSFTIVNLLLFGYLFVDENVWKKKTIIDEAI